MATKTTTRYFCDWCGEEQSSHLVESGGFVYHLNYTENGPNKFNDELCRECSVRLLNFRRELKLKGAQDA